MTAFQTLEDVSDRLPAFSSSLPRYQQSTLWTANTEETPITEITVYEIDADLILTAQIPEIDSILLTVKATQETILIQGKWKEVAYVEGFFQPGSFQSLIPLPCAVHPKTLCLEIHPNGLFLQLTKQVEP